MTLTDEGHPSMFRGQEVYLIRTEEGLTHITQPMPRWLTLCDSLRTLHLYNHDTMPLKLIWAVLDMLTIVVIVSGFAGWFQRHRRKKEIPPVLTDGTRPITAMWSMPALFALLSIIGMTAPLSYAETGDSIGTVAWGCCLLLMIYLWQRGRQ